MTKWFCDRCGKEIPKGDPSHKRLEGVNIEGRFSVEVTTGVDQVWNSGLLCHDCVRALVAMTANPEDER